MPVKAINFAALPTANTGMPDWMQSFSGGVQAAALPEQLRQTAQQRALANALSQIKVDYQPRMNDSTLAQQAAMTDLRRQQAQYYGPEAMSRIGLQGAQAALAGQQAQYYGQDTLSQMALRDAQARLANVGADYAPLKTLIQGTQVGSSLDRFGGAYQLSKSLQAMPTAARATWIANNQDQYNQMLADLGNKSAGATPLGDLLVKAMNAKFGGVPQQAQQQMSQQIPPTNTQYNMPSPQQLMQATNQAPPQMNQVAGNAQGMPQQSNNMQSPLMDSSLMRRFMPSTPEQVNQTQLANQLSANKSLISGATQKQNEGGIQIMQMMNDPQIQQQAVDASQYAGALRKGKEFADALSQKNPAAYENYISFVNTALPAFANRIKAVEGMASTDAQREELHNMFDKTMKAWSSNPDQFIKQYNKLGELMNSIHGAVNVSASPLFKDPRDAAFQPINMDSGGKYISAGALQEAAKSSQPTTAAKYTSDQLSQWAEHAISQGADRKQVEARIKQLSGGK